MPLRGDMCAHLNRQIVHEAFEEEILAINLDTGTYFSLTGSAVTLWPMLLACESVDTIVERFAAAHDGDPDAVKREVLAFLERLHDQQLIGLKPAPEDARSAETPVPPEGKVPFAPFVIEVFTDMQDLLLLDPVHDAAEAGWPLAKPEETDTMSD